MEPPRDIAQFIIVFGDSADEFERNVGLALAQGFKPYGEYHFLTYVSESEGRVEEWSIAMTAATPKRIPS
jgi:hypothetical protein